MAAITAVPFERWDRSTTRPGRRSIPRWSRLPAPDDGSSGRSRSGTGADLGTGAPTTPVRRRRSHQRVYRRRRLAAVLLLVVLAFCAGVVLALALTSTPANGAITDEARRAQEVRYVVEPGDTLWKVAHQLAPGKDPRAVVDELVQARGGARIQPGDLVVWPVE